MKERKLLKVFCDTLNYPIYYLGIKAVEKKKAQVVQYVPYQYSLHIEYSNGFVEHKEYIVSKSNHISEDFAQHLCKDIPLNSTIVTHQENLINTLFKQLIEEQSSVSSHLEVFVDNLIDVTLPFKENWQEIHSLKQDIHFRDMESLLYDAVHCNKDFEWGLETDYVSLLNQNSDTLNRLQNTLLEYFKIDTLLMVEVVKRLRRVIPS